MRKSIGIALFLLTFSTVCAIINGVGIFEYVLPESTVTGLDGTVVEELSETGASALDAPLGSITFWGSIFTTLSSIVVPVLYLPSLLCPFGIPFSIAILLNIPVWFIYGWDVFLLIANRSPD